MGFFLVMLISSVAGSVGWWIGNFFGFSVAFVLSSVTSLIGYYYGQKWNREYFG